MKKKSHEILEKIRELIISPHFKDACRMNFHDFTRERLVTFPVLLVFILNLIRRSLQSELNNFIRIVVVPYISKQTFSAARIKLSPIAFVKLNNVLVHEYYTENEFRTFCGYRLVVIDGSTLQLPESKSIREKYGACGNQEQLGLMAMARTSYAYDPLSEMTLDAILSPYVVSERAMVFDHVLNIRASDSAEDLYLLDRGYPSIALLFFLHLHKKDFVIRCCDAWLASVREVLDSGKRDVIIEIKPRVLKGKAREEFRKRLPEVSLKSHMKIRVLIIDLPSGEKEILVTSLLDKTRFEHGIFKELYHLRWGGEENYKFHKVRIEIENFSGESTHAIEQDFHATVLTANIRALIAEEAQEDLDNIRPRANLEYGYKINKNISAGLLKDEVVQALLNPEMDLEAFCTHLKERMQRSTIPIRPGRSYERTKQGRRKYPMNRRRAL